MQILGFARTWPTYCFINGGCGEQVFAHTNGFGDFVLFDCLGWPWPVHECFENRFCHKRRNLLENLQIRIDALEEYLRAEEPGTPKISQSTTEIRTDERPQATAKIVRPSTDIRRAVPEDHVGKPDKIVFGYIQDYVENRAERLIQNLGTIGQECLRTALGSAKSQITIVTSEFESFTAYADLRNVILRKRDMVAARLRAIRILGIPKTNAVFLCNDILLVLGRPVS